MLEVGRVLGLFVLLYLLPGCILLNRMLGDKEKRFENIALAILLSLVLTPLIFTQVSRVVPSSDIGLIAGFSAFWAVSIAWVGLSWRGMQARLPDFSALPKADSAAWLLSALVAAAVLTLRLGIFRGYESLIADDHFHLNKLTSIAATGLPSLYARQPLYAFSYYDLDYIVPGLWVRYSGGAVEIAQAWVIHIGIQSFAVVLFLSRLLYTFVRPRIARLFGLVAIHLGAGLDLYFIPFIEDQTQVDSWPIDLHWFDGFMQFQMPFGAYLWAPQHVLGVAIVGLIGYLMVARPGDGSPQVVTIGVLMAALFKTSTFVFAGVLPGMAIWHVYSLLTGRERIRQLLHLAASALIACALVYPSILELFAKRSFVQFGLRPIVFLETPWLKYPFTVLLYLFLEMGILVPLLLWAWMRPQVLSRPLRFWLFVTAGTLIPFVVRTPLYNDIAMRGVMPAQMAAAVVACPIILSIEQKKRSLAVILLAVQFVISVVSSGADYYFRFTREVATIPQTSQWIARNVPTNALVFFEQDSEHTSDRARLTEVTHSRRMTYLRDPTLHDFIYSAAPPSAWRCLPEVNLYDANSICSVAAAVPGDRPIYLRYLTPEPALDEPSFASEYVTDRGSVFSLSCPTSESDPADSPHTWLTPCRDSPWTVVGRLKPLTVNYDGGISLQELAAHPDGGGGAVLTWKTATENETVFAVSFRLYDVNSESVYQQDAILFNRITGNTSSRGHPRLFRTLVLFDFANAAPFLTYNQTISLGLPDSLAPGEYELRLIVYDADTLQAKVNVETWEPEVVLARLHYSP